MRSLNPIGIVLIIVIATLGYREWTRDPTSIVGSTQTVAQTTRGITGTDQRVQVVNAGSNGATTLSNVDLIATVRAMCTGSCAAERFVPLPEANGVINPNGVKFLSDYATFASFTVPAGWSGQIWDGYQTLSFTGPVTLPQVAEGSFRYSQIQVSGA